MAEEALLEELEEEETEEDQYLVFRVSNQEFGIRALQVREITVIIATTRVPNAPAYVEGILNLRGKLATVINFRSRFNFETKEQDEDTRIIIVEHEGYPIGILVDSVEEVIRISSDKVQTLPLSAGLSLADEKFITGIGMLEGRLVILLDIDRVLNSTDLLEADDIEKAVRAAEEARGDLTVEEKPIDQKPADVTTVKKTRKR